MESRTEMKILKKNNFGELKPYPPEYPENASFKEQKKIFEAEWDASDIKGKSLAPNLKCECSSENFKVCWWDYPYTGGCCWIYCSECGNPLQLIDDYS